MWPSTPDFEADIRFFSHAEGGRRNQPRQGYRPDIHWDADTSNVIWMIWPRFLDQNGAELPDMAEVPQSCQARFYIFSPESASLLAQQGWLSIGAGFHIVEGDHRVAACRVTKIFRRCHAET